MQNNHCHRVSTQLQLINVIISIIIMIIIIIIIIITKRLGQVSVTVTPATGLRPPQGLYNHRTSQNQHISPSVNSNP
jgi:hypothetical protein